MNSHILDYYTQQSRFTDPGEYATSYDLLPSELTDLHKAINGLLIHMWKIRKDHPHLLEGREDEVFIRKTDSLLARGLKLNDQPLNITRPVEQRMIIDCRHFSLLLCSILRHRGIPARTRCGFATYLEDTFYMDHWICEYWSAAESRWIMEDADLQMHDVAPEQFITGARAWQLSRKDKECAHQFGMGEQLRGIGIARVNLVRDFAALHKFVSVSGDGWGLAMKDDNELTDDETHLLDQAAMLAETDAQFDERLGLFESSNGLCVPTVIQNFDYVKEYQWRDVEWLTAP